MLAPLQEQGLRVHHYLDDIILLTQSQVQLLEQRTILLSTLQTFGWIVNLQKSQLEPTQNIMHLRA